MSRIVLFIIVFGLVACSSPAPKVSYYLLYTPLPLNDSESQIPKNKKIVLNKIVLANYLKQSNLVMQINQNQMYFARQDVWAESLESSIFNALLADLNQNSTIQFNSVLAPNIEQKRTELTVQFDHFHATDKSTVVGSGHFWINLPTSNEVIETPFFFSLPLQEDGFSHAVLQQRELLHLLALNIQQVIDQLEQ
jgi:uncharacterized protein